MDISNVRRTGVRNVLPQGVSRSAVIHCTNPRQLRALQSDSFFFPIQATRADHDVRLTGRRTQYSRGNLVLLRVRWTAGERWCRLKSGGVAADGNDERRKIATLFIRQQRNAQQ